MTSVQIRLELALRFQNRPGTVDHGSRRKGPSSGKSTPDPIRISGDEPDYKKEENARHEF
ncbi:hypothetical protein CH371_10290 [Leptospira wolffii]|uniref:Uncharacterized protein n=1 Tax=Leptospira wolffii TaxID=409998 RepID=A0A2M9ZC24_9LEPT|nr:hypothetical protein CH371_10290 [Leptospira wolffii]